MKEKICIGKMKVEDLEVKIIYDRKYKEFTLILDNKYKFGTYGIIELGDYECWLEEYEGKLEKTNKWNA